MAEDVRVRFTGEPENLLAAMRQLLDQNQQLIQAFVELIKRADFDPTSQDARELAAEIERTQSEFLQLGRQGAASLERVGAETDEVSVDMRELRAQVDRLEKELEQARLEAKRFGREGSRSTKGLVAGFGKARAAMAGLAAFLAGGLIVRGIRQIAEISAVQARADRQLALAIEGVADAERIRIDVLKEQASALQAVTTFGDEAIQGVQNLLLRYAELNDPDVLQQATETVLDLATTLEGGLQGSAQQVAKSLALLKGGSSEVSQALTNLRRVGIILTEQQQESIRTLASQNRSLEAQQVLLDVLQDKFKGTARAAREDVGGAFQAAKNAAGDFLEEIGEGGLSDALVDLAKFLQGVAENSGGAATKIGAATKGIGAGFKALGNLISAPAGKAQEGLADLRESIDALPDPVERVTKRVIASLGETREAMRQFFGVAAEGPATAGEELEAFLESYSKIPLLGSIADSPVFEGIRAYIRAVEEAGDTTEEQLARLVDRYEEAGLRVPPFVERLAEPYEELAKRIESVNSVATKQLTTIDQVAAKLAEWRAAVQEVRDANREAAEEATRQAQLQIAAVGDLSAATDEQLEAVESAVEDAVEAWRLYGEEPPRDLQRVAEDIAAQRSLIDEVRDSATEAAGAVREWLEAFDVEGATAGQLEEIKKRVRDALDEYELLGEQAPAEVRRVAEELGVLSSTQQEAVDEAKEAREEIAEAYEGLAEDLAETFAKLRDSGTGGGGGEAEEELQSLREELSQLRDETEGGVIGTQEQLNRLAELPGLIAAARDRVGEYAEETGRGRVEVEELDDAIRDLVDNNAQAFAQLTDAQRQQITNALTQLQSFAQQGIASGGSVASTFSQVADVLESAGVNVDDLRQRLATAEGGIFDIREAFESLGDEAESQLAKQVEGWEQLDETQQRQVEALKTVAEEHRKSLQAMAEETETAGERMEAAMQPVLAVLREIKDCLDDVAGAL